MRMQVFSIDVFEFYLLESSKVERQRLSVNPRVV